MKFSIITIVKNNYKFIQSCIDSVNSQIYDNIEHIIIDGGSTDGTLDIINNNLSNKIRIISELDSGIYQALNKGIKESKGDVIAVLHTGDYFYSEDIIQDVNTIFRNNPEINILIGDVYYCHNKNCNKFIRFYKSNLFKPWMIRFGFMPAHTGTFLKKSYINKIGLYNEDFLIAGDFEFFVRTIYLHKEKLFFIKKPITIMSVGGLSSNGFESYITSTNEMLKALNSHKIYSNYIFLYIRLPIKYLLKLFFNFTQLLKNIKIHNNI